MFRSVHVSLISVTSTTLALILFGLFTARENTAVLAQTQADQGKRGVRLQEPPKRGLGIKEEVPKQSAVETSGKSDPNKPELVIQNGHSLGVNRCHF